MTSKLGYLSAQDIFRDLGLDEVEQIGRLTTMTTCAPRKVFYEPEDKSEVLFLLKKGRVQLYRLSPGGKKMVTGIIEAGAFFGEMALIGQGMHRAFAEALEDCVLCVMSRADVERYLLGHPKIAMRLTEALGNRLVEAEARLEEMAFKGVPARLASLLLRLAPGDRVEGYTHQDFAEAVGSYRETVTQTLNEFKAQGLVEIERKAVRLLDRERLHAIASSQENNQK
jgi:CRP-like cAMP-binding protein